MAYKKYLDSSNTVVIDEGVEHDLPISILVIPNSGNVQIQFMEPPQDWADPKTPEWFTPADSLYTLDEKKPYRIDRGNCPAMRIIATGDARFSYHNDK